MFCMYGVKLKNGNTLRGTENIKINCYFIYPVTNHHITTLIAFVTLFRNPKFESVFTLVTYMGFQSSVLPAMLKAICTGPGNIVMNLDMFYKIPFSHKLPATILPWH